MSFPRVRREKKGMTEGEVSLRDGKKKSVLPWICRHKFSSVAQDPEGDKLYLLSLGTFNVH